MKNLGPLFISNLYIQFDTNNGPNFPNYFKMCLDSLCIFPFVRPYFIRGTAWDRYKLLVPRSRTFLVHAIPIGHEDPEVRRTE